ncbi:hypothetical protein H1C71_012047 [Ictidomys tridecemlineatus]|nr:hypothetical protein H1C71_012047 [Ictidomys tridecemlineatus]
MPALPELWGKARTPKDSTQGCVVSFEGTKMTGELVGAGTTKVCEDEAAKGMHKRAQETWPELSPQEWRWEGDEVTEAGLGAPVTRSQNPGPLTLRPALPSFEDATLFVASPVPA